MNNKNIFITGITGGIGSSMANKFLKNGYNVMGSYIHKSSAYYDFISKFPKIRVCKIDNLQIVDIYEIYLKIFEDFQPDILVNNAGIVSDSFISQMKNVNFLNVLDINLISPCIISRSFYNYAINKDKNYKIINISSISGIIGKETQSNYSLTKGGLIGLSQLIEHMPSKNVSSISIAPGMIDTNIKNSMSDKKIKDFENSLIAKRMGLPYEVANFVFSLSQSEITYCNGNTYLIDGGVLK